MAIVHIPTVLRELTGGATTVTIDGGTVADLVEALDTRYPGIGPRLVVDGKLRPGLHVFVDGDDGHAGLRRKVEASSDVHFLQAISGGEHAHG